MSKKESVKYNKLGQWHLQPVKKIEVTHRVPSKEPKLIDAKTKTAITIFPVSGQDA